MNANRRRVVAAACAAVLWIVGGCVVSSGPAWSGSQASVSLTWTINGRTPSATLCSAVGGEFVMLWASPVDPGCRGGEAGCGDALPAWAWECGGGAANTGLDFRAGDVWLSWGLVNAEGAARQVTSWQPTTLTGGNRGFTMDWTVGWIGGPNAAVSTQWTIGGLAAGTDTCAAVGGANVRLSYRLPGGAADSSQWPCAGGAGSTGTIFRGFQEYELKWELLDAAGTAVATLPATGWETHEMVVGDNAFPVDFPNPAVADASIAATWTLRGAAADATSCGDALAVTVRLIWRETGTTAETTDEWACADGTGSTDVVLFAGTSYDFAWELLEASGDVLLRNDWATSTPVAGSNPLATDFLLALPDASIAATWTVRGAAADATACGDALAATVRLSWRETGATAETTDEWACADGTGSTDVVLFAGTSYDFAWELLEASGDALVRNDWAAFTPVAGANPRTTDFLVGGRLDVTLEWADKTASPAWGDCALPPDDVDRIGYLLADPVAGTIVDQVVLATGGAACVTSLSWTNLPFAGYTLTVDGQAASPATATWHVVCPPLTVDGVADNTFTCQVVMVTP